MFGIGCRCLQHASVDLSGQSHYGWIDYVELEDYWCTGHAKKVTP